MEELTEDYVPFDVAQILSLTDFPYKSADNCYYEGIHDTENRVCKKGDIFPWPVQNDYEIAAPTVQMALKYLRIKGININIIYDDECNKYKFEVYAPTYNTPRYCRSWYDTYEDAVNEALDFSISLVEYHRK